MYVSSLDLLAGSRYIDLEISFMYKTDLKDLVQKAQLALIGPRVDP